MKESIFGLVVLSIISAAGFLGCSSTNSNGISMDAKKNTVTNASGVGDKYPQSVAEEFLKSCEKAGSKPEFCACVFEKVQQQYTFEEFSVIESKIMAGRPPDEWVEFSGKARAACTK